MAKTEVNLYLSKQYLIFVLVIIAVVFLFAGFLALSQSSKQQSSLITVSASGSVIANPTQSTIYLFLNATGGTSGSAVANLSVITGGLNATLLPFLNGNSSMIQTVSYNVYQTSSCANFTYYPPIYPTTTIYCPSPRRFFIASEYLLLTIPNVTDTNAALVGLSGISGVSIGNVAARLSQQQQANMSEEALSLALSNATGQAQALAGGRQLQVRNITVQSNYLFYAGASVAAAPAPSYNQTFYPGRATVTKSIYVVFSMH